MINGRKYDHESITIHGPHGEMFDVDSLDYSDKKEVVRHNALGKGGSKGYGEKAYEASGTLKMDRLEYERMCAKVGHPYRMKPFTLTATYANEDQPTVTDTLTLCKFHERKFGIKTGDETSMVEIPFVILGEIKDNGRSLYGGK